MGRYRHPVVSELDAITQSSNPPADYLEAQRKHWVGNSVWIQLRGILEPYRVWHLNAERFCSTIAAFECPTRGDIAGRTSPIARATGENNHTRKSGIASEANHASKLMLRREENIAGTLGLHEAEAT